MNNFSPDKALLEKVQYTSIFVAIIICAIKSYTLISTDSAALAASLVDSLMDVTSSIINLVAIKIALMPPDHNHRFGHNKIEDLAVFGQSIFIFLSGIYAFYSSAMHFFHRNIIENTTYGIAAMVVCSVITVGLVIFQSIVIKKTQSSIIKADKLHYLSDLLTNLVVIVSLLFGNILLGLDAVLGVLISSYVIYGAYGLFIGAMKNLIDEEFSDEDRQKIINIISKYDNVLGVHDIKTRYAGNKPFIQFHIELAENMKLVDAHKISDQITDDINKVFEGAEIIIHQDPFGYDGDVQYEEILRK